MPDRMQSALHKQIPNWKEEKAIHNLTVLFKRRIYYWRKIKFDLQTIYASKKPKKIDTKQKKIETI